MGKSQSVSQLPWKILIYAAMIFIVGFILFSVLYLTNLIPFSWALGWLLGSLIGTVNYLLIIVQANRLTLSIQQGFKPSRGQTYMVLRLGLFTLGLLAGVYVKLNSLEVFNLFTIFAAYLVISGIIFITGANFRTVKK